MQDKGLHQNQSIVVTGFGVRQLLHHPAVLVVVTLGAVTKLSQRRITKLWASPCGGYKVQINGFKSMKYIAHRRNYGKNPVFLEKRY